MRDRILAALEPDQPLGALARSYPMPCCVLVALALREAVRPGSVVRGLTYDQVIVAARRAAPAWWAAAMIADATRPWSSLAAAEDIARGTRLQIPRLVGGSGRLLAPEVRPGRAYVIQRWLDPALPAKGGHTYFVFGGGTFEAPVTVIQSSEAKGYRVAAGAWDGTAGLAGWCVGSVELPDTPP